MPKFSSTSLSRLETCDQQLQDLFREVIKNYDCSILCGYRTEEEQTKAFEAGNSSVQYPNSKHNSYPSKAVDVSPYPIDWDNRERFYHFAGYVRGIAKAQSIHLRWGGDWNGNFEITDNSFDDLVHFELVDV